MHLAWRHRGRRLQSAGQRHATGDARSGPSSSWSCVRCKALLPRPQPQVTVGKSPPAAAAVVKSDSPEAAEHVVGLLQTLLLTL